MNKTISALFDTLVTGSSDAKQIFDPLMNYGENVDKRMQELYSENNMDIDRQNEVLDICSDISYISEKHGFEQGLRLGLRLSAFAFGDTEK